MAWLSTTPEESSKEDKRSRYERLLALDPNSPELEMPPLESGTEYLVGLLNEVGPVMSNGMSIVPVTWQEINNWLRATELELGTWELTTIRQLSRAYSSEFNNSSGKNTPCPWINPEYEVQAREEVSRKLKDILFSFKKK